MQVCVVYSADNLRSAEAEKGFWQNIPYFVCGERDIFYVRMFRKHVTREKWVWKFAVVALVFIAW